ncbi:MAG: IS5 family transposase [Bacteroidota bacterium]
MEKTRKHGASKRRTWRKLHLAIDPETGEITATEVTDNATDDASQVEPLLQETLAGPTDQVQYVYGDGAYDKWKVYRAIEAVGAEPVVPPQKNAKIKRHGTSKGPRLARDEALRYIRGHGRSKWKRQSGYHRRSLAETGVWRFKRVVGRVLRSRCMSRQETEARIGSKVLNDMLSLGRPESYALLVE